ISNDDGSISFLNIVAGLFGSVDSGTLNPTIFSQTKYSPGNELTFLTESFQDMLVFRDRDPSVLAYRDADYYLQSLAAMSNFFHTGNPAALAIVLAAIPYDLAKGVFPQSVLDFVDAIVPGFKDNPNNPNTPPGGWEYALKGLKDYITGAWK